MPAGWEMRGGVLGNQEPRLDCPVWEWHVYMRGYGEPSQSMCLGRSPIRGYIIFWKKSFFVLWIYVKIMLQEKGYPTLLPPPQLPQPPQQLILLQYRLPDRGLILKGFCWTFFILCAYRSCMFVKKLVKKKWFLY